MNDELFGKKIVEVKAPSYGVKRTHPIYLSLCASYSVKMDQRKRKSDDLDSDGDESVGNFSGTDVDAMERALDKSREDDTLGELCGSEIGEGKEEDVHDGVNEDQLKELPTGNGGVEEEC